MGLEVRLAVLGNKPNVKFPSTALGALTSTDADSSPEHMRESLNQNGYLYIKSLFNSQTVYEARRHIYDYMEEVTNQKVWEDKSNGVLDSRCGRGCVPFMEGKNPITADANVTNILENSKLKETFEKIFGCEPATFDYKWLRAMYRQGFTGAHVDNVYMCRGTPNTLTCWIPIDDVSIEKGGLAICEGSHRLPSFQKFHQLYSNTDIEAIGLNGTGWFTDDPWEITEKFGGYWKTADFTAGDVLIFTMKTVHMSLANQTDIARVSCDTRWYPRHENPDLRYVGDFSVPKPKYGLFADSINHGITILELKERWGL